MSGLGGKLQSDYQLNCAHANLHSYIVQGQSRKTETIQQLSIL